MLVIRDIIQHYNPSDHQEIIKLINGFNEVESKSIVKDLGFVNPNIINIVLEFSTHYPMIKLKIEGGYENANRKKIIIYPEFIEEINVNIIRYNINYVNKFQKLEHKHVLGTILNNGIKESMLGDIIINDVGVIQIVLDSSLDDTIHYLITKISNLTISFNHIEKIDIISKEKKIKVYRAKSLRCDCSLKAILKVSRTKTTKLIKSSKVKINYSIINDITKNISEKDIISVRGYGQFEIMEIIKVNTGYNIFYK